MGQLDLRAQHGQQARVVPGFLNEIARAAPHRFDGQIDTAPCGHDHHGQIRIDGANAAQQIQTFTARSCISRIVEIHKHDVQFLRIDGVQDTLRRRSSLDLVMLGF